MDTSDIFYHEEDFTNGRCRLDGNWRECANNSKESPRLLR